MRFLLSLLIFLAGFSRLASQILPDRMIVLDPLERHEWDTAGFSWLTGTRLFAEFARYSDGSGTSHRWNAKTGLYAELARWDSTASIAIVGTTEVIMDPLNDIAFNPRTIFWEEGMMASFGTGGESAFQFGYMHRCKHDIDNYLVGEERTLIYSGIMARELWRPRMVLDGPVQLHAGFALRNDFFLHLLDSRSSAEAVAVGASVESLIDAVNLYGRLDLQPRDARYRIHLSADFMLSLFGAKPGFTERFSGIRALGSFPFVELGIDLFNPRGSSFTIFARGEWQRDAGIHAIPAPATLVAFGVRVM